MGAVEQPLGTVPFVKSSEIFFPFIRNNPKVVKATNLDFVLGEKLKVARKTPPP